MTVLEEDRTFKAFPKVPRLTNLTMVVTEKVDGTNAAVAVFEDGSYFCQSRKRIITPVDDNFGFASWVKENEEWLIPYLGPGRHYGEWWGQGIQRNYGLKERRWSLFNVNKWSEDADDETSEIGPQLYVVPVLWESAFSLQTASWCGAEMRQVGSYCAPGFMNPEGVMIYCPQLGKMIKHPYGASPKGNQ